MAAAVALAGCQTDGVDMAKAMKPLSPEMLALMESKGMDKNAPILVRLFKEESELEIWKRNRDGKFALLKTYPICRWSGELGPKIREGDRQAPEGFYTITPAQMNPRSQYYLSFDLGYPNAFDRALGRTGSHLMIHGDCSSRGCYSMTDEQIAEIYALGREAFFGGQKAFQVQAYPFRMTPLNMARHRNNPHFAFWKMLKEGNDHFEVTRAEPKVDVCEKRYVFNAQAPANASGPLRFNPTGPCPTYEVPSEIATEVAAKARRDELAFAEYVRRGTPTAPVKTGQDGGMHPTFVAALRPQQVRDEKGNVRWIVEPPPIGTRIEPVAGAGDPRVTPPVSEPTAVAAIQLPAQAPMPRPAPRRSTAYASASGGAAAPAGAAGAQGAGVFNGLLSSPGESIGRAANSVARAFGFRSEEPKPEPAAPPAGQQAARTATRPASAVAARSEPKAATKPAPDRAAAQQTAQAAPQSNGQAAEAQPAGTANLMPGAQPVLPTGGFENRWPATFR